MNLDKFNSLIELFFYQSEKQDPKSFFLQWLNPNNKKKFTWEETKTNIFKLSKTIKENEKDFFTWKQVALKIQILSEHLKANIADGDRCVLLSENRPEWLVSDIAIMNAGGITVPLFTTYSEKDYEYILNDCKPKICIVSNNIQFKKLEKFILNETKILSIEKFNEKIENLENIFFLILFKIKFN